MAVRSVVGRDPDRPQKVNQDNYFVLTSSQHGQDVAFVGVLDGHGLKGHILTEYLARFAFPSLLQDKGRSVRFNDEETESKNQSSTPSVVSLPNNAVADYEAQIESLGGLDVDAAKRHGQVASFWIDTFHKAQRLVMEEPTVNAGRHGSTCIVVGFGDRDRGGGENPNDVTVAHVGDSRVIAVTKSSLHVLSTETTLGSMPSERARIEQGEGRILPPNVFYGPQGIAMTRSLGNAAMLRACVVPTPVIENFPASTWGSDRTVTFVLATDGIWDVLSNEMVATLVRSGKNLQTMADTIVKEAQAAWTGDLPLAEEAKVDDITCVLVRQELGSNI